MLWINQPTIGMAASTYGPTLVFQRETLRNTNDILCSGGSNYKRNSFWDMMPYSLVDGYWLFWKTRCLITTLKMDVKRFSKYWYPSIILRQFVVLFFWKDLHFHPCPNISNYGKVFLAFVNISEKEPDYSTDYFTISCFQIHHAPLAPPFNGIYWQRCKINHISSIRGHIIQYNTIQHNTTQHNTTQHNIT